MIFSVEVYKYQCDENQTVQKWTNCIHSYFTEGLQGWGKGSIKSPRMSNICVAYIYSIEFTSMHSPQMFLPTFMLSLPFFFFFFCCCFYF